MGRLAKRVLRSRRGWACRQMSDGFSGREFRILRRGRIWIKILVIRRAPVQSYKNDPEQQGDNKTRSAQSTGEESQIP